MRNLRTQLLLSHLMLVLLMAGVMSGAVFSFFRLGGSIDRILHNNYTSVIAAQDMKETLERQDSAATFFLAGEVDKAHKQYEANAPLFEKAVQTEVFNVTEPGEQEVADDLHRQSEEYRTKIRALLYATPRMPSDAANHYYFQVLEPAFVHLKQRAQDVLDLNQAAIVRADLRARREAEQAAWIGIGVTFFASVFATAFALTRISQAMEPLRLLARQAEEIGAGRLRQRIELRRSDEIGGLAGAFNAMSEKLAEARRAQEERLERAERLSDAALSNLYDPVLVSDAEGCVVHLNRAAEGLFGPEERAVGQPVWKIVREPRITIALERAIRLEHISAEEGESALVSLPSGAAASDTRTYRLRVTPMVPTGSATERRIPLGAVAVLEDVTYLRELDRMKTEFIGVASHELRTPVTSLLLATQLLQEGALGSLRPDQAEIVGAQREDLNRLQDLLRDLLDMTRLESGAKPPRLEIVSVRELIETALSGMQATAREKGVTLTEDAGTNGTTIRADRGQLGRVLTNLLTNAVRHTSAGGSVRVFVQHLATERRVRFVVEDTGDGIPKEYLPHIFERFVQVPGATRGGAGLGLSISQAIVRAHGGEITVQSEPGKGSTFAFTLARTGE